MKIALVNKAFSARQGGGERYAVNLAKALSQGGHEVHLFGSHIEDVPGEAHCHIITAPRWPSFRKILGFSQKVRSVLKKEDFHIVYGLTQHFPVDLYRMGGGVYKHWMNLRYRSRLHKWLTYLTNPVHSAHIYLESEIFKPHHYRRIITNSYLCKEHAMTYYGVPENRIEVIYTGVDRGVFHPGVKERYREKERKRLGLEKGEVALVFISHNWKRKGLETIMQALSYLSTEGKKYKIICVGKSKRRPFEKLAQACNLTERVLFCPPSHEIEKYYSLADIFVLPTLYDPFSNVCLEAMSCGVPVITSTSNGASEIIEHGVSGYVVTDPCDDRELAGLLRELLNENLRHKMGKNAAQSVESFTIEKNMTHTLRVFEELKESR